MGQRSSFINTTVVGITILAVGKEFLFFFMQNVSQLQKCLFSSYVRIKFLLNWVIHSITLCKRKGCLSLISPTKRLSAL